MAVAPLAGAWIETSFSVSFHPLLRVAPLAGAWIETLIRTPKPSTFSSRPSRARGLKRAMLVREIERRSRAPRGRVD